MVLWWLGQVRLCSRCLVSGCQAARSGCAGLVAEGPQAVIRPPCRIGNGPVRCHVPGVRQPVVFEPCRCGEHEVAVDDGQFGVQFRHPARVLLAVALCEPLGVVSHGPILGLRPAAVLGRGVACLCRGCPGCSRIAATFRAWLITVGV